MWNRITFENNQLTILLQDTANLFDPNAILWQIKRLFKNSSWVHSSVTEASFPLSKALTHLWTFSSCATVFAADTALRFPLSRRRRSSSLPRTFTPWVHSRLLRGTRLSLMSNPKATHRHVPGKTLGPYIGATVLIGHVEFIDRWHLRNNVLTFNDRGAFQKRLKIPGLSI